jgi:hypothetical protein
MRFFYAMHIPFVICFLLVVIALAWFGEKGRGSE